MDIMQTRVDPDSPAFAPMLKDLQANILKAHGRSFAHHIFLQIDAEKAVEANQWIAHFAETRVTSAWKLEQGRRAYKATGEDGGAVFTISLSATGYAALGFSQDQLPKEQESDANKIVRDLPAFPHGAKSSAAKLGDRDPGDWEAPFRGNVDVLIVVADDGADKARQLAQLVIAEVEPFSVVLLNQKGHVLYRKKDGGTLINIEHFGYADGVSQPLFFQDEVDAQGRRGAWDDAEPLNLVLVADPHGQDANSCGSFLVFRKLEQNVAGFMRAEEAVLSKIRDSDGIANPDLPGAMMIGRFRNGNPLVTSGGFSGCHHAGSTISNDFDYGNDTPPPPSDFNPQYSSKCPFFSHIRVTNPRSDITVVPPAFVHSVRLTRRAVPYQDINRFGPGKENLTTPTEEDLNSNRPESGVGLLFMSYQAHIGKQFEFIHNNWANHGHIAGRNIGPDGVIGQASPVPSGLPFRPPTPDLMPRRLPQEWGREVDPAGPAIDFGGFVNNKGGEYFFTPSISFLRLLAPS